MRDGVWIYRGEYACSTETIVIFFYFFIDRYMEKKALMYSTY